MKDTQYWFRGYDKNVIESSPHYIKVLWKMNGFDLSHRAAISWNLLEELRSEMNQSLAVSGFRESLMESAKQYHLRIGAQWHSYVDSLTTHRPDYMFFVTPQELTAMHHEFYEFDAKEYGQPMPSCSYLIERVVRLMEEDAKYITQRMQMIDGKHLSGDHSFKLTKCVAANGTKAFTAMYTLMNETGQVVGWWFTTGTGMKELEDSLKKIKDRYKCLGFEGPFSFTTDRCCQERSFLGQTFGLFDDIVDVNSGEDTEAEDTNMVDIVALPRHYKIATCIDMTKILVGEISNKLRGKPAELSVISIDAEWRIGRMKADLLQIGTLDGCVYLFHLSSIIRGRGQEFPLCLKMLLEIEGIQKVGNRVHNDKKALLAWGVEVKSTIELGHLAHARALCSKAPALDFLVGLLWPGVILEGKGGSGPRISDWSSDLEDTQCNYAALDAYATMMAYRRLMQIMDPKVQRRLKKRDIFEGLKVTVYQRGWKTRVAEATVIGKGSKSRHVRLQINLEEREKLFAPGTFIYSITTQDGEERMRRVPISALRDEGDSSIAIFDWPLYFCRCTIDRADSNEPIKIHTVQKAVVGS